MKNSNTLNTRLLPLSILISSLVSGGAMAVPTQSVSTGDFERVAPVGSFMVTSESEQTGATEQKAGTDATEQESGNATAVTPPTTTPSEQEITEPEQPGLLEKITKLLGLGEITEDQAKALTENVKANVKAKAEKVDAQAAAKLALESAQAEAQKAAEDALYLKTENVSYQAFAQTEEKIKKEAAEAKTKQDEAKNKAIVAVEVSGQPLDPKDSDVAAKVIKAVATTTQAQKEKAVELDEKTTKAAEALEAKDANTKALKEIEGRLTPVTEALTKATDTDKVSLDEKLTQAQEAKTDKDSKTNANGGYKELFAANEKTKKNLAITEETANNDSDERDKLNKAKENLALYNEAAQAELNTIAKAEEAVKAIDAKIRELTKNQGLIKKEQSTEEAKTGDLDTALGNADRAKDAAQDAFNEAMEAAKLAETAAKAIEAAKITDKAVEAATAAHQEAADKAKQTQAAFEEAEKVKTAADKVVEAKNGLLTTAKDELEQLIADQNSVQPTPDLPAIDVTIEPTKTQDVIEGTSAIATQVAGGTQNVAKGGKAIDSVITKDGIVNLAAGANAKGTEVTKGTLNNNGGVDTDTVVGAEGKLVLTGSETAIATSTGAKVAAGGVVTAGSHSVIEKMISSGDVAASGNAIVRDTTINDGKLSLAGTATANNTTFNGGIFSVEGDTAATKTTMTGGKFAVTGNAKIDDTVTGNDGALFTETTLNDGQFSLNNGAIAKNTEVNGGQFNVNEGATAEGVTVKGGEFNLRARAQAMKLTIEHGEAQIAGTLTDVTLRGGNTTLANTADVAGTIHSISGSALKVYQGAHTAQADLNLAGRVVLFADDVTPAAALPSRAVRAADNRLSAPFTFRRVNMSGGTLDLRKVKNTQLVMDSLAGNGTFELGSMLQQDASAPVNVTGNADGDFTLQIDGSGIDPTNLNVVSTGGGDARFTLTDGPIGLGNRVYNLVKDASGKITLVANESTVTPGTASILAVANTTPVIFNAELSSVQQRLDKQSTEANESGMWGTYLHNNFAVKGRAANFDQTLNGMTLGGDKATALADGILSVGGFASASTSSIKTDYQSKGNVDSHSFGAYTQYLANNGDYVNGVVKANKFNQAIHVTSADNSASGNTNFSGMGVAVKAGKHINHNHLYVSPYVAMSAFSSGKSAVKLSNGMAAQSSSTRSMIGTLGVNAGYRFVLKNGVEMKPYVSASVDHEFAANNKFRVNQEMFDNNLNGTRVNTGAGLNVNITPNLSVGSEVKLSSGKNIKTPVTVNLNVGYRF